LHCCIFWDQVPAGEFFSIAPNYISAVALPQTRWGAYIAPPDTLSRFNKGAYLTIYQIGPINDKMSPVELD